MSLTNLSLAPFLIGLAAIAAVLAVLQLLRVRYQRVNVVTTMFWREAIEESRARVLMKRFRHPWAYLLVLAIAALVWWAFAEPRSPVGDQGEYLVLLDGSAAMLAGDRYANAVEALTEQIGRLPKAQRRVFWCGGDHRLLLDRGEETLLLSERLRGRQPEASPASVESFIEHHLKDVDQATSVFVLGEAEVSPEVVVSLPKSITLKRIRKPGEPLSNAGIVAVGVGGAASGGYELIDLYVRTKVTESAPEPAVVLEPMTAVATEINSGEWVFRDLPADGSTVKVRLLGLDDLAVDNEAQFTLPRRELIRVQVAEPLQSLLRSILAVDPAVQLVDESPDVVFGETSSNTTPTFLLASRESQQEAFVLNDQWPDQQAQFAVESAFRDLGIDQIDATSLATDLATTIQLGAETGAVRQVRVWADLFSKDYNLVQSSAFPLFIAKSVRWLANSQDLVPYLAVGERSEALNIAGVPFAPPSVGAYETVSGELMNAVLGSSIDKPTPDGIQTALAMSASGGDRSWMTWLVLLALLLLLLEWGFFQKGWMP